MRSRECWTLIVPATSIRIFTGEEGKEREEGSIPRDKLAILMPGFGHTFKRFRLKTPFGFTALQMDGPFPKPLLSILQHPPQKWQERTFAVLPSPSLNRLFWLFAQEIAHPDGLQLMSRELFLILLGAELTRLSDKDGRARFPTRLEPSKLQLILDRLEAQLGASNNIPELSKLVGYTPDHFIRIFREATNCTPHQYLIERRLQRAVQLLSDGERALDVANSLGFYDAAAFTRAFKSRFGLPPSKFAEEAFGRQFRKEKAATP
jgi:AraC-like DNA-binding protein